MKCVCFFNYTDLDHCFDFRNKKQHSRRNNDRKNSKDKLSNLFVFEYRVGAGWKNVLC